MPSLLLTGHSGFLGRILLNEFLQHFEVHTLARSEGADIRTDLVQATPILTQAYDWVVHNAGIAHTVPKTDTEVQAFYEVNVKGTENLLTALEDHPPKFIVLISTVAVYGKEAGEMIDESHHLSGTTPYALSKIQAEKIVREWCASRGVHWLILRLPLVVGPQPPGNLGEMMRIMRRGLYLRIGGNCAQKSMILGADIARFILSIGPVSGIYNLTDGVHPRFCDLEDRLAVILRSRRNFSLPPFVFRGLARIGDMLQRMGWPAPLTTNRLLKMTSTLTFSDEKARREHGWNPRPVLDHLEEFLEIQPSFRMVGG